MTKKPTAILTIAILTVTNLLAAVSLIGQENDTLSITRIAKTSEGIDLNWTDLGRDRSYTIQRRESLSGSIWVTATDMAPWPTPATSWTDRVTTDLAFYRVGGVPRPDRGKVISVTELESLSLEQVRAFFALAEIPVTPEYGVDIYRVIYETAGILGEPTQASGALFLPRASTGPFPLVSYQHGTIVLKDEAPSSELESESLLGGAFAATGYATVLPDYLGLGESPGLHPYHYAHSEATAGIDMLRAVRQWSDGRDVALNGQLFLCGYSQGGHATIALHRRLQQYHADELSVTASAPMAGAYDLSGATRQDLVSGRPMPNPYYTAYLLAAYQRVYRFSPHWSEWLASPYDEDLPPLLNGEVDEETINSAMPSRLNELFTQEALEAFESNPQHPLRVALRDNDVHDWSPKAPMRLYHCPHDEDVIFRNAEVALESFHSRGATHVKLIVPDPEGDHADCTEPSLLAAKAWFDSLRE